MPHHFCRKINRPALVLFALFRAIPASRFSPRLVRYMDLSLKARDLEIRASAVHLSYERFRLDAARKPADCPAGPQSPDDREKTEQAMLLLFGEEPARFVSQTGGPVAQTARQLARPGPPAAKP